MADEWTHRIRVFGPTPSRPDTFRVMILRFGRNKDTEPVEYQFFSMKRRQWERYSPMDAIAAQAAESACLPCDEDAVRLLADQLWNLGV